MASLNEQIVSRMVELRDELVDLGHQHEAKTKEAGDLGTSMTVKRNEFSALASSLDPSQPPTQWKIDDERTKNLLKKHGQK